MTHRPATVLPITRTRPRPETRPADPKPRTNPGEFAGRLRQGREQRNLSLHQIADTTKISISQLQALERGDVDALPGGIYRRAMIRQYANAIGANVDEALRELAESADDAGVQLPVPPTAKDGDHGTVGFSTALWITAAAFCILGAIGASMTTGWAGWYGDAPGAQSSAAATSPAVSARDIELELESAVINTGGDAGGTEGELRITSVPAGAQVTVNGIGWNVTPVTIRYLPLGEKLIRVTKSGYAGQQRSVELDADRPAQSIRIELSPEN